MGLIMIPASRWVQGMMALLALVITIAVVPVPRPASPPGPVAIAAPMKGSFHPAFLDTAELTAPIPTAYTQLPAVLYGVQTTTPAIALTFDLDMTPGMLADLRAGVVTSWINTNALAYLKETHTPATLFMTGMWAETYPQLARQLAQSGQFEIANHSYSHTAFHHPCYGLASSGTLGNDWQVTQAQKAIQRITGVLPRLFRFPGGCYNPAAVAAVHRLGLQPVEWTVNSLDAFNRNPGQIVSAVTHRADPGGIVIMHLMGGPNAPDTGIALRAIIPALQLRGYRFVSVSDLLKLGSPMPMPAGTSTVEAAPVRPLTPTVVSTPNLISSPAVRQTPQGWWVWTPWGWQLMSKPPACRWVMSATYPKHWVCV